MTPDPSNYQREHSPYGSYSLFQFEDLTSFLSSFQAHFEIEAIDSDFKSTHCSNKL